MTNSLIFANNANTTLAGAITNTATSLNVAAGGGALFPNPTGGQYFVMTLVDAATGLLNEIMWCTARSGDVFTVVRGQEGTTALNWNPGDIVAELWTAGQAAAMQQQGQAPSSLIYYGQDTGAVNQIVATVVPAISALSTGNTFEISPLFANTSSTVTVNISSLGAQNAYRYDGSPLLVGDIQGPPFKAWFTWDATATKMLLQNPCTWVSSPNISFFGNDTGAPNAYVITNTIPPFPAALATGDSIRALIGTNNGSTGGAATMTITLLGGGTVTKNITRADGSALQNGDIAGGEVATFQYDGTKLQLGGVLSTFTPARNLVTWTSHGSYSWTVPTGIYQVFARICGAGGGGGSNYPAGETSGGGGGSGGYAEGWFGVTPGQVINLVVGQGGVGSTTYGVQAGQGGTSSAAFGASTIQATGGTGGICSGSTSAGGVYGEGSGGQLNLPGGSGGDGNPNVANIQGGAGAASTFGGGGRTATVGLPSRPDVVNGVAYGSGGGGIWQGSSTNNQGGDGADGAVLFSY